MARGVNKVILIGNVGNDVELKYTQGGMAIASVSLATTSSRKDKEGNQQEKTEWHRVKFFGKLAEIVGEYVNKGSQLYVEGRIEYGKYTAQDGTERYTTDIIADQMQMLGGKRNDDGGERPQRPQQAPRQQQRQPGPQADFDDDSIPF